MVGRSKRSAPTDDPVGRIYREMLAEAGAAASARSGSSRSAQSPPLKRRRRPGDRISKSKTPEARSVGDSDNGGHAGDEDALDEEDDLEFEDVQLPVATLQTLERESDDEEDEDIAFEDVVPGESLASGLLAPEDPPQPRELSLNLSLQKAAMSPRRSVEKRRPMTNEERWRRVVVHKVHLLCLLSHASLRNRWCDDPQVQDALRPLLSDKMLRFLNPPPSLSQFGRTESLKNGLQQVSSMFRIKYAVTERGLRRALWAESEDQLQDYQLPDDVESIFDKQDFVEAARSLEGSRDVGAQLFCALLRSAGVRARLVCSLQPLACVTGAPTMAKVARTKGAGARKSRVEDYRAAMAVYESKHAGLAAAADTSSPRRRLGHPQAAGYQVPVVASPSTVVARDPDLPKRKPVRGESPFPVYWVEVLDVAHQKWHPVDPLVTRTQWKPKALEPPASDRDNCMTYVVAFEADGSARDVTRRYAKAYNAKTRKMRVDGLISTGKADASSSGRPAAAADGARWWRRALRRFARPWPTDLDQIEDNELAAEEAREPMPRNVADFKDHPVYALERHLRRHEVLVPGAQPAGTVGAGSKGPLERIYRRTDVRVARSRDKWYRLGRVVRPGEEPVKVLPKRTTKRGTPGVDEDDEDDPDKVGLFGDLLTGGTPLYTFEQTEQYMAPPVVDGRVPKNKFGNLEVYVPTMVPRGGVHVAHERAAQAAFVLGVDYAPAVTGFRFQGRHGTAVMQGVVIPSEPEEAVRTAIAGLEELDAEAEQERRTQRALRLWSRFLKGLRIRERIWAAAAGEEEGEAQAQAQKDGDEKGKGRAEESDAEMEDAPSDVTEEYDLDEGGGFLIE